MQFEIGQENSLPFPKDPNFSLGSFPQEADLVNLSLDGCCPISHLKYVHSSPVKTHVMTVRFSLKTRIGTVHFYAPLEP